MSTSTIKDASESSVGRVLHIQGSARMTQIFGLCFYWAWVYLSFNTTSSINLNLGTGPNLLWVHLASMLAGVVTYALIIVVPGRVSALFTSRKYLIAAGIVMALGTACYALPLGQPLVISVIGAVLTGIASCWVVIYWGTLFSALSARDIVICTAASFFCANVIYFVSLLFPQMVVGALTTVMPLCAALLIPDSAHLNLEDSQLSRTVDRSSHKDAHAPQSRTNAHRADRALRGNAHETASQSGAISNKLSSYKDLPWRVSIGLFVVMFVYGGVRVFIGVSDASVSDGLLPTVLLTFAVAILFAVWGIFFQGDNASLGMAYKMSLPLLATVLLLAAIFGQEYVSVVAPIATVCDITIEILSWMLLADLARTTHVPAFLVFACGRLAVQAGMFGGQLTGWIGIGYIAPFAMVSIFALMLVMGFAFQDQDTFLAFETPTPSERENVERLVGRPMEDHLVDIAAAYGLTDREKEIFVLWATGHGSRYIQDALTISASTVKTHVRHIYEKCGVHSRAEVIALLEQSPQR
ncbi:MAG: LuxR C-terminal-related transcriptional regulator [Eggerthellaceae bacterium]|nr:LuxR C-terminal-related transcriptional regulator [Eggerthellaceae bacterium]MCH4221145.1 LuxR C-terminal-related transcriptional regulator [Eggerthellaceae bacterium]